MSAKFAAYAVAAATWLLAGVAGTVMAPNGEPTLRSRPRGKL